MIIDQKNPCLQAKFADIPALIPNSEIVEQIKSEKDRELESSVYPIKYISAIDCQNNEYKDEFTNELAPITPHVLTGGVQLQNTDNSITYKNQISCPPLPILARSNEEVLCIIDYLSCTFSLIDAYNFINCITDNASKVSTLLEELNKIIPHLKSVPQTKGIFGYKQSVVLIRNGLNVGLIGFDGNNGTCLISLSGAGCMGVDMSSVKTFLETLPRIKLTRVDIAHDDLNGGIPVLKYLDMYKNSEFDVHGKTPSARFLDDLGSKKGSTLYVGSKKNGKEACIYEKGKQLGDKDSPWVRLEGRISNVDRIIPLDVLINPAPYLAALYPPFAKLSVTHTKISVTKKTEKICIDHLIESATIGYGRLLNYMVMLGYSDARIVETLKRDGVPKRLLIANSAIINNIPF
jgi:phage replication initiation protein